VASSPVLTAARPRISRALRGPRGSAWCRAKPRSSTTWTNGG